jgi:hypothetical protein
MAHWWVFVNVISNTRDETFDQLNEYKLLNKIIIINNNLFILAANGFLPGGSCITIRHNTQKKATNKTQNSTYNR